MSKYWKLLVSILLCESVGFVSTPFTVAAIPTWYTTLNKPFFSPPNWVFGPVWTTLYALMGVSIFLILTSKTKKLNQKKKAIQFFGLQLVLNFLWSILFFGLRSPFLGFLDIVLLLGAILVTIRFFSSLSKIAGYLLYPYLLWVSFATILNLSILILNR